MDHLIEQVQRELNVVGKDIGFVPGKTVKMEYTENLGYFFRVNLKSEKTIRNKKEYKVLNAVRSGIRFVTSKLEKINDNFSTYKSEYERIQKTIVQEILSIAGN